MPGWTLLDNHLSQGRTFHRPLDALETSFIWGSLCDGASDSPLRLDLHLSSGAKDAQLFSDANIVKAWLSTKRRYPLVGATIQTPSGAPPSMANLQPGVPAFLSEPHFIVRERDLTVLRLREIIFAHVASLEEVDTRVHEILDGPRPLSQDLLTQLYVFRETGNNVILHLMTLTAHCVGDLTAINVFARCFLDTLARGGEPEPAQAPLEERLTMALPLAGREPIQLRSLSPARRRWRKAIASVILQSRIGKIQGGHTLPCRLTSSTSFVAARPRSGRISITVEETATVLANCRRHKVAFGNAYLALAQVAMTRLLYRRYLRGDISEEEWAYRKKEPNITAGPFNLRPYLDKSWFEKGGGGESPPSMGTFFCWLPAMPLGETEGHYQPHGQNLGLSDGAPPFSELLSFDQFLHRTELVKRQADAVFQHPLFHELINAWNVVVEMLFRKTTLEWLERIEAFKDGNPEDLDESDSEVLEVTDMPVMLAHGGSNFGDLDAIMPLEYPLPPTHPLSPFSSVLHPSKAGYITPPPSSSHQSAPATSDTTAPKIVVQDITLNLHTRPAELYLFAWSTGGRMDMYCFYDSNVFEEAVVEEWLDEIKGAVLWYLGRPHESRRTRKSRAGKAEAGPRRDVQAKL